MAMDFPDPVASPINSQKGHTEWLFFSVPAGYDRSPILVGYHDSNHYDQPLSTIINHYLKIPLAIIAFFMVIELLVMVS